MQTFVDYPTDANNYKFNKLAIYLMIVAALFTLGATLYVPIVDGDIWFHLLYGKAIMENLTLTPDHTIYSWTPSTNEHIYCAWISQIFYYLLYTYFGNGGIIVIRYIAASVLFVAILSLSFRRNTFYNPITWLSALLCSLIIGQIALDKPEIFSFSLMTLIVWNWYCIKQNKKRVLWQIYLFPLIILIWVNTHGAFVFGCLFLLCVGVGETINQFFYSKNALTIRLYSHLFFALILSVGATFITPYGYEYVYQLAIQSFDQQLQSDLGHVQAYSSTFAYIDNPHISIFANVAIGFILLVFGFSFYKKQLDFVPIVSNLLFAFLFTVYGRLMFPWVIISCLSIIYYCGAVSVKAKNWNSIFVATCLISSLFLSIWFFQNEIKAPARGQFLKFGISEYYSIDEEIDFLINNYKEARLANSYDHGSYILWKHWPRIKVMMDARYFPYKKWFKDFISFNSAIDVEHFIAKYPFDAIAIKHIHSSLIYWFFKSKDWKFVFYGKNAAIFVRSSLALSNQFIAGNSLNQINEFTVAKGAFNTSIMAKDWTGSEIVLNTMRRNFPYQNQHEAIAGLSQISLAGQMYEQKKYSAAIDYMEKAFEHRQYYHRLYGAALLMQATEDWLGEKWILAVKNMIKSTIVHNTFAGNYNLALMGWQLEKASNTTESNLISLDQAEKDMVTNWRTTLKNLIDNKPQFQKESQKHYSQYFENAENILNDNIDCKTEFMLPAYN